MKDLKVILPKETTLEKIVEVLSQYYDLVEVFPHHETIYPIVINSHEKENQMHITLFFGDWAFRNYEIEGVLLSPRKCPRKPELLKILLEEFGGLVSQKEGKSSFLPYKEFLLNEESSYRKTIELEMANAVGHDKLKAAMKVIDDHIGKYELPDDQMDGAISKGYREAGHNAYFGEGFKLGFYYFRDLFKNK